MKNFPVCPQSIMYRIELIAMSEVYNPIVFYTTMRLSPSSSPSDDIQLHLFHQILPK